VIELKNWDYKAISKVEIGRCPVGDFDSFCIPSSCDITFFYKTSLQASSTALDIVLEKLKGT
jgi:hypothetical protein